VIFETFFANFRELRKGLRKGEVRLSPGPESLP
jgi:hypothetical protein